MNLSRDIVRAGVVCYSPVYPLQVAVADWPRGDRTRVGCKIFDFRENNPPETRMGITYDLVQDFLDNDRSFGVD